MATELIAWPSPAKLNLFLHITGRRADGYHQLQSLFQLLDYGDTLKFAITADPQLKLMTPIAGVADQDNLVMRAATALKQWSGCPLGADIWLEKKLPMGGGIGGGSSNAATTLVALNYLWGLDFSMKELAQIGLKLGADVPVFTEGYTAFAEGVGEKLTPMPQQKKYYLVVSPNCHISTAEIFAAAELPRNTTVINANQYTFTSTRNDCQNLVFSLQPAVAKAFNWLIEYAPSRMTGTGACVFAIFDDEISARTCLEQLPAEFSGFVAQGVNRSPLHELLATLKNQSN
ncbi:4-(cytidine 5'-diphospho)-2-C-methyl-D-erythritol kinase [Neptunicella sp. SCSIO 80796]|uniref:4-(cytidine 5'-diphospho)-2-C-methyl-D-erythritol kinase n=1 Tax=Neptunicella plasticusilytica TaxID=3117012 RepID=UPI003A4D490F